MLKDGFTCERISINQFHTTCLFLYRPENIRKPDAFLMFQEA